MRPAALLLLAALSGCADELSPVFTDAGLCNATLFPTLDAAPPDGGVVVITDDAGPYVSDAGCRAYPGYSSIATDAGLVPLPTGTIRRAGALLARAELCGYDQAVELQLYADKGGLGAIVPGTYELAPADASFATCGICVRLFTQLDVGGNPGELYMARSGTLILEDIGGEGGTGFAARLRNVALRQVNIDPYDFTTVDVGSCESRLGVPGIGDLILRGSVSSSDDAGRVDSSEVARKRGR